MKTATVDGYRCREARERIGLTQPQLASRISAIYDPGISYPSIAHIELGNRQPSAGLFVAMCTALGVPRDELLVTEDEKAAS